MPGTNFDNHKKASTDKYNRRNKTHGVEYRGGENHLHSPGATVLKSLSSSGSSTQLSPRSTTNSPSFAKPVVSTSFKA